MPNLLLQPEPQKSLCEHKCETESEAHRRTYLGVDRVGEFGVSVDGVLSKVLHKLGHGLEPL